MAVKPKKIEQIEKDEKARLDVLHSLYNPYDVYFFVSDDKEEGLIFEACNSLSLEGFEIRMCVSDCILVKVTYE